ncbi:MAG: CorA family divalent cation transporter [Chloroflexota bacterium]|nr:CorA family divalent cation transporter [Lentimicrobium sp.]
MGNIRETKFENFEWLDITGPHKEQLLELAKENNFDYLQVLDSLEHGHLPKIEKVDEYNFIILRAYTGRKEDRRSTVSELSNKIAFFYNPEKLITVHKASFDFIDLIDQKFNSVSELLIYIINEMVETFVEPSEWHSDRIDQVEKVIFLKDFSKISVEELYFQKSQTRIIKKLLQITMEVVKQVTVEPRAIPALQDVKDRLVRLILIYDEAVEDANNLMSTYLAITASKSNDVMKLLTVFSAFFLPLTFIVGVYGMNFHFMPELHWKYGYLFSWLIMITVSLVIFWWFRKKKIIH